MTILTAAGAAATATAAPPVSKERAVPRALATIVHHPPAVVLRNLGRWIIPGQEIVSYRPGARLASIDAGVRARGGRVIERFPLVHAVLVQVPLHSQRAVASIAGARGVVRVEPNVREDLLWADCTTTPGCPVLSDPYYSQQWYLENDRGTVEPPGGGSFGSGIDAPRGWLLDAGSASVRIAVVDTGIDLNHPDVAPRVIGASTLVSNNGNLTDYVGHGTAVAGVAAAIPNNQIGIAGVAYNASLVDIKVSDDSNANAITCPAEANGIVAAMNAGARVINVSIGSPVPCTLIQNAVTEAWNAGDMVVAAAGNGASNVPEYPAAYNDAISVAATDSYNRLASFSNWDASWVDMAAPGVDIFTTVPTYANTFGATDYTVLDGTSFSAPMVSGAAALLFAEGLSNQQVAGQLFGYADPIGGTGTYWRYGILDVCNSIAAGRQRCPPPRPAQPQPQPQPQPQLPTMSLADARRYVNQELKDRFGPVFRHHSRYARVCSRDSRTQLRCRSSWQHGKYDYAGNVVVYYILQQGTVYWSWRLQIKRVSHSCSTAHPRRRCAVKTYH